MSLLYEIKQIVHRRTKTKPIISTAIANATAVVPGSSRRKASQRWNIWLLATLLQLLVLQQHSQHVLATSVAKGLTRTRSAKIARIHGLQAVAESITTRQSQEQVEIKDKTAKVAANATVAVKSAKTKTVDGTATAEKTSRKIKPTAAVSVPMSATATTTARDAGKYEVRSVSGEPNYKSVNLTWEVEFVPSPSSLEASVGAAVGVNADVDVDAVTNSSAEVEPPNSFQIFFCELQSFGPQRCRSKLVDENQQVEPEPLSDDEHIKRVRHYAAQVDNLRMATKYSFHIRPKPKRGDMKVTGRSEVLDNEIEDNGAAFTGQTIIIPTKGFTAEATKCLPHASEIEVETGPYFGGKIVVDGGNCGVKGNPNDPVDKYTMRINHKMCGSLVKPETNTVETFITVQENLGIYTHSTRRFVVVCSYQSGMQTVRASFTVPGKGGVAAPVENDPFEPDERIGRGLRQMRYVDKSALVLKEPEDNDKVRPTDSAEESAAMVTEVQNPVLPNGTADSGRHIQADREFTPDTLAVLENIVPGVNERHIKHENEVLEHRELNDLAVPVADARSAKYAKLVVDQAEHVHGGVAVEEWYSLDNVKEGKVSSLKFFTVNMGSVVLTICLSVIIIGVLAFMVYRQRRGHHNRHPSKESNKLPQSTSMQESTLPRSLQRTHQLAL